MTILYVLHTTNPGNGASVAFMSMLQGLIPLGVTPVVALPDQEGIYHELKRQGVEIICSRYRMSTFPYLKGMKNKVLFLPRLIARLILTHQAIRNITRQAKECHVDMVHTNTSVLSIGYHVAKRLSVPHVYHIREYADKIGLHIIPSQHTLVSQLGAPHSYAICISRDLQAYYRLSDNNRSVVSYDGGDTQQEPMPHNKKEPFFLLVGRVQQAKGLELLLEAYASYHAQIHRPYPLYIAGGIADAHYYHRLMAFVRAHDLDESVNFMGQRRDVDQLMQRAVALILTSPYEGFGLTFMEAARKGCLIIGRYTTGVKEQMDNGKELEGADIALAFQTTSQLASIMIDVTKHTPNHYDLYRERAYRTVCSEIYDQKRNVQRVFDFYNQIIQREKNETKNNSSIPAAIPPHTRER